MKWTIVAVVAGIGCGAPDTEVVTGIGEFAELHVEMTADGFELILGDDYLLDQGAPCAVVRPELTVRLDDVEVPIVEPGAFLEYGSDEYQFVCAPPRLHVATAAPYGLSRLELHDGSGMATGTVTCVLPDLRATRALALEPPGPWELGPGEQVTVRWSPGSDLAVLAPRLELRDDRHVQVPISGATIDDDHLTFEIPFVTPGAYTLEVRVGGATCQVQSATTTTHPPIPIELTSAFTDFAATQPVTIR